MPHYIYECSDCGYSEEQFSKTILRGPDTQLCPECGRLSFFKCIGTGKMFVWGGFKGQDYIDRGIS